MALDQLIPHDEVLEEELKDPEFRAQWESTALARWLAVEVAHYRAEHDLSQRALADQLGVHQSDVARMETGEHTPTLDRLIRVAGGLGIELMIDIHPRGREAKLPKKSSARRSSFAAGDCEVVVAVV